MSSDIVLTRTRRVMVRGIDRTRSSGRIATGSISSPAWPTAQGQHARLIVRTGALPPARAGIAYLGVERLGHAAHPLAVTIGVSLKAVYEAIAGARGR